MTTLTLAQRKITASILLPNVSGMREWFLTVNRGGVLSLTIILIAIFSLSFYIAGVYYLFDLGFQVQHKEKAITVLGEDVSGRELLLQRTLSSLVDEHKDIIQSMEKVSFIQYLEPADFVTRGHISTP